MTPGTTATTRAKQRTPHPRDASPTPQRKTPILPLAPESATPNLGNQPVIPLTIIDAPSQRFYAFAVYVGLFAWRFYDWIQLVEDDEVSWWLFLKWVFVDCAFLFGLPELRIPWLELSQPVVFTIFAFHAVLNYTLMFNIPVSFCGASR
jgi:nucleoporin POM152